MDVHDFLAAVIARFRDLEAFKALTFAVLTVSDSRTLDNDSSGDTLAERIESAGHRLAERR
ncbi:MAG TPA: hypothetical protein VK973_07015, partial [Arenicellales bacterium]|nr:hypothetical protein [Arenicellales bacterium]